MRLIKWFVIVILIGILSGCATVNPAKKDQLMLTVPQELLSPPSVLIEL